MGKPIFFADFELKHLEQFVPRESAPSLQGDMIFNMANPIFRFTLTMFRGEEVIGIVGYHIIASGTCEVYLIPGNTFNRTPRGAVEALDYMTDNLLKGFYRVQMAVTEENRKWAHAIGFKLEAYLEKYHAGKDQFIYVKVKNGT